VFPVRYKLYLCVPYGSPIKQRLFPQTALTGWIRVSYEIRTGFVYTSIMFGLHNIEP
jgi:hypothetical protein